MNPLAALIPDWRKKKEEIVKAQGTTPMPPMNREGRRNMMKQIRKVIKQHGLKAD